MKQTALEYLVENIHYLHSTKWNDIIEQAKEMEKQQIIDAHNDGHNYYDEYDGIDSEEYYNETFKNK